MTHDYAGEWKWKNLKEEPGMWQEVHKKTRRSLRGIKVRVVWYAYSYDTCVLWKIGKTQIFLTKEPLVLSG